jgi:hypothetical protein
MDFSGFFIFLQQRSSIAGVASEGRGEPLVGWQDKRRRGISESDVAL